MIFYKPNIIGRNVKRYRINRDLTQDDLAAKLTVLGVDIDRSALSRIENQERQIYDYELFCISKALNIDINLFFKDIDINLDESKK